MTDQKQLSEHTQGFFDLHWGLNEPPPQWNYSWRWCGAVPNYQLGGLYALFSGDRLLYIGLGASKGGGIYKDRGISRRLLAHVLQTTPKGTSISYEPQNRWKSCQVDLVATIGFPADRNYLACALEDYLIGDLNPPENQMKRRNDNEGSDV